MNDGRLAAVGTPDELRGTLDLGGTIRFEVEAVPDGLGLETVAGIETVTVEDGFRSPPFVASRSSVRVGPARSLTCSRPRPGRVSVWCPVYLARL